MFVISLSVCYCYICTIKLPSVTVEGLTWQPQVIVVLSTEAETLRGLVEAEYGPLALVVYLAVRNMLTSSYFCFCLYSGSKVNAIVPSLCSCHYMHLYLCKCLCVHFVCSASKYMQCMLLCIAEFFSCPHRTIHILSSLLQVMLSIFSALLWFMFIVFAALM